MQDDLFQAFLECQHEDGTKLAAESDLLTLGTIGGDPPQRYTVRFLCRGLVKNPAGFNQAIRLLGAVPPGAAVLVAINDLDADGRDVSWLWDSRLEDLAGSGHRFGATGIRAHDMALRLKYAGIEAWSDPDTGTALARFVESVPAGEAAYVVPTYTAMLDLLERLLPGTRPTEAWQ